MHACACRCVLACVLLLTAHACTCAVNNHARTPVCVWPVNLCGSAHTVFYRGASPTSIRGMLVSSAPDNSACSIIMRRHTPLGTHKSFSSFASYLSPPLWLSSKGIFFKPPFSGTGEIASTLNQLHSTSNSTESVPSIHTHCYTLIIISPKTSL